MDYTTSTTASSTQPRPRGGWRRFAQFSLRRFLLVVVLVAGVLGHQVHYARQRAAALRELETFGHIEFDPTPMSGWRGWQRALWAAATDPRIAGRIRHIELFGSGVDDEVVKRLELFPELWGLTVASPHVTRQGLRAIGELPGLVWLQLQLLAIDDDDLQLLTRLTSLKGVALANMAIDGAGLTHLMRLPSLESLSLLQTNVTDATLGAALRQRASPLDVYIAGAQLCGDVLIAESRKIATSSIFDLDNTTDDVLASLAGQRYLWLDVGGPDLTDRGIATLREVHVEVIGLKNAPQLTLRALFDLQMKKPTRVIIHDDPDDRQWSGRMQSQIRMIESLVPSWLWLLPETTRGFALSHQAAHEWHGSNVLSRIYFLPPYLNCLVVDDQGELGAVHWETASVAILEKWGLHTARLLGRARFSLKTSVQNDRARSGRFLPVWSEEGYGRPSHLSLVEPDAVLRNPQSAPLLRMSVGIEAQARLSHDDRLLLVLDRATPVDGRHVLSAWDTQTARELWSLPIGTDNIDHVGFDGRDVWFLEIADLERITLVNLRTGIRRELLGDWPHYDSLWLAPDASAAVLRDILKKRSIYIDTAARKSYSLQGFRWFQPECLTLGKRLIALETGCNRVTLYDRATGEPRHEVQTPMSCLQQLWLTDDDRLLVGDFGDEGVITWDVADVAAGIPTDKGIPADESTAERPSDGSGGRE